MSDIENNKEEDEDHFFQAKMISKNPSDSINQVKNEEKTEKVNQTTKEEMIDAPTFYKNFIRDPGIEGRKASRVLFVRHFNNWIKAVLINKYTHLLGYDLSVLDLGCGRGGDLIKFFQTKVKLYVGADISEESLKNAMERLKKLKQKNLEIIFMSNVSLLQKI